jgi:hypothetical protein
VARAHGLAVRGGVGVGAQQPVQGVTQLEGQAWWQGKRVCHMLGVGHMPEHKTARKTCVSTQFVFQYQSLSLSLSLSSFIIIIVIVVVVNIIIDMPIIIIIIIVTSFSSSSLS